MFLNWTLNRWRSTILTIILTLSPILASAAEPTLIPQSSPGHTNEYDFLVSQYENVMREFYFIFNFEKYDKLDPGRPKLTLNPQALYNKIKLAFEFTQSLADYTSTHDISRKQVDEISVMESKLNEILATRLANALLFYNDYTNQDGQRRASATLHAMNEAVLQHLPENSGNKVETLIEVAREKPVVFFHLGIVAQFYNVLSTWRENLRPTCEAAGRTFAGCLVFAGAIGFAVSMYNAPELWAISAIGSAWLLKNTYKFEVAEQRRAYRILFDSLDALENSDALKTANFFLENYKTMTQTCDSILAHARYIPSQSAPPPHN